jgi:hypothetical protein
MFAVALAAAGLSCLAAGTTPASGAETALAAGSALRIKIETACKDGDTIFKVLNTGQTWPKTSTFGIYRLTEKAGHIITTRRMRLTEGQQASFRISAKRNPTGRLGLVVQPGWYTRKPAYDATVACR